MTEASSYFSPDELQQWQFGLQQANLNNVLCHCRQCDYVWVASTAEPCRCGSQAVEAIPCWQFPDD